MNIASERKIHMKLILPDGSKIELDNKISLEEKRVVVDKILEEWNPYFQKTWKLKKTQVCLEIISNYLCNHKDENVSEQDEMRGETNGKEKSK
jgi:hypothetical protein